MQFTDWFERLVEEKRTRGERQVGKVEIERTKYQSEWHRGYVGGSSY